MPAYAQTYLQLHHQIQCLGYSKEDIQYLRRVYEFGMQIFSGYVQGYGKSFLSHGVGTASVLASLKAPTPVVAAGLIHNIYEGTNFGDRKTGVVPEHQKVVIGVVGTEAEAYVATFNTLCWSPDVYASIRDQLTRYHHNQKMAVLIHLADHVEHNLDHGTLYFFDEESAWRRKNYVVLADMAIILGYPTLGNEIRRVHQEHEGVHHPDEFKPLHTPPIKRKLVPRSCRRRYSWKSKEEFGCWLQSFQQATFPFYRKMRPMLKTLRNWLLPM